MTNYTIIKSDCCFFYRQTRKTPKFGMCGLPFSLTHDCAWFIDKMTGPWSYRLAASDHNHIQQIVDVHWTSVNQSAWTNIPSVNVSRFGLVTNQLE